MSQSNQTLLSRLEEVQVKRSFRSLDLPALRPEQASQIC